MTIKKLLTLAAAVLCAGSVWAQKDVTSLYITNATLSDGTNGWTVTNFNNPVSGNGNKNIAGNNNDETSRNTSGYASEAYAGWDKLAVTAYSALQKITLPAGHYTLVNYSFFRQGQAYNTNATKSLAYLKAGDSKAAIKTLGSITAAGYANSQIEGSVVFDSKMYRNTLDFTIDVDNTEIEIGVYGTFDEMRSWCILGQFELVNNDIKATIESPFDVTGYITNPGFEYRDMSGWTLSESGAFGTQVNDQSFKTGFYYAEKWQSAASGALTARSMSQTLSNLPAGYYQLKVNLGGNGTYVDLNGKIANWTEDKDYTVGYVLSENEDLTIKAGKTAEGTANWIHFDNFKLYYCGDVQAALTTLLNKVSDYNGVIPAAAYSALQSDVAAYNKSYSDVDELLAAIDAVQALYDAADLLKAPYAAWKALKAKADILVAVANDNATANSTLSDAISTQNTAAEAATTVANVEAATSALKTAMQTYVFAATPVGDGAKFDCTFLMTNPDLTGLPTWTTADGWYTDQDGGNSQVMTNDGAAGPHGNAFFEYWSEAAAANDKFTLYQKVTLPEGTYSMKCDAFSSQDTGGDNCAVYFYANDTQGDRVNNYPLAEKTISFVNNSEQEVKIGLKALTGNTYRWMGIGYVELYKVPAQTYTIDETATYDNSQSGAGDVTLNRTISAGLNTLVLPFSMTQAEVESTFGAGSKVYVVSAYDEGKENITFAEQSGIQPNVPCLLEATVAGTSYTIEGRTIVAGTPTVSVTGLDFIGTYTPGTVPMDSYVISGSNIYKVDSNVSIKSTRAYFTVTATGAAPSRLTWSFDGDATGIDAIDSERVANGAIYNLNGQRVNTLQKGINIVNGKKVFVK